MYVVRLPFDQKGYEYRYAPPEGIPAASRRLKEARLFATKKEAEAWLRNTNDTWRENAKVVKITKREAFIVKLTT